MSHQGNGSAEGVFKSAELVEAVQWLLTDIVFGKSLHRKCSWTFRSLVMTALFWAWSPEPTAKERFSCAQRLTCHLDKSKKRRTSFQAFMEILRRHTAYVKGLLLDAFRAHMESFTEDFRTFGYVVFSTDGSDLATAITKSNQKKFTTNGKSKHQKRKKNQTAAQQKQKRNPRILMTTLYHVALGLPWNWMLGGKSDNERGQLLSMLGDLPKDSLIVADAGFTGYEFLDAVIKSGSQLLVRVGSNVTLIRKLGNYRESNNIVYLWPKWVAKKNYEPLKFRLIVLHDGRKPVYLISSILDNERLSDQKFAELYRMRWKVELYHRNIKQTMGRRKMLSHSPDNALVEAEWTILGYTAMMLYAVDEFKQKALDLKRLSPVAVIRAFQTTARDYLHPHKSGQTILDQIGRALMDNYKRKSSKTSRQYPRRRKYKQAGEPEIIDASKQMRINAKKANLRSLTA